MIFNSPLNRDNHHGKLTNCIGILNLAMYWSKPHLFPFLPCPICIPKQMMRCGILFPNIKSIDISYVCIGVLIFARDAWVGCLSSRPISRNAPIKIKIKAKSYMTTTTWKSRLKPVPYSRVFALRSTAPKRNQWNSWREASRKLRVSVTKRFNISSPSPPTLLHSFYCLSARCVHLEK